MHWTVGISPWGNDCRNGRSSSTEGARRGQRGGRLSAGQEFEHPKGVRGEHPPLAPNGAHARCARTPLQPHPQTRYPMENRARGCAIERSVSTVRCEGRSTGTAGTTFPGERSSSTEGASCAARWKPMHGIFNWPKDRNVGSLSPLTRRAPTRRRRPVAGRAARRAGARRARPPRVPR